MHCAPPVCFPLGRSRFGLMFSALLILLAAATVLTWTLQSQALRIVHIAGGCALLPGAVLLLRDWIRTPSGHLEWGQKSWKWSVQEAEPTDVAVELVLDFQSLLLVRLRMADGAHYGYWLQQRTAPERWLDLRRALVNNHLPLDVTL